MAERVAHEAALSVRTVQRVVRGIATHDGAGVALTRVIGQPALNELDPFLLLDEFRSDAPADYLAGFPDHPHRGFETVTYMLAGRMRHRDSQGNSGLLTAGSVQWMTAGRGIVHSEMPEQEDGLLAGFQLWVNLPASAKMSTPRYQDIGGDRIPLVRKDGVCVRVIAGTFDAQQGPVQTEHVNATYLDVTIDAGARFETTLPRAHSAFAYVFDGAVEIGAREASREARIGELALLGSGDVVQASSAAGGRLLLIAGRPLGEPIARYGPIVMNTKAELAQAFDDLRSGAFVQPAS